MVLADYLLIACLVIFALREIDHVRYRDRVTEILAARTYGEFAAGQKRLAEARQPSKPEEVLDPGF